MQYTLLPASNLKSQWRRQILKSRRGWLAARKGLVAYTLLDQGDSHLPYVEIANLLVLVLYEDEFRTQNGEASQRTPLRFCGYAVECVPHGVQWGGVKNSRLYKDLMLVPKLHATGQRIDIRKDELLASALQLDRCLARAARYPATRRGGVRLPRLWAGFRPDAARAVQGEGPEFDEVCRQLATSPEAVVASSVREFDGLQLWPLEWVSGRLELAATVFAEMTGFRRPLVARIQRLPDDLLGFQGASGFDFYHNQFRRTPLPIVGHQVTRGEGKETPCCGEILPLPETSVHATEYAISSL